MTEMGAEQPTATPMPNIFFDVLMREMGDAELRITLAIIRHTFGNGQPRHKLSLTDFQSMTGLSRQGAINGIDAGIARGTIQREADGRGGYFYSALVNEVDQQGHQIGLELVNDVDQVEGLLVNVVDQPEALLVNDVDQVEGAASQRNGLARALLVNGVDQQEANSVTRVRAPALGGGGLSDLPISRRSRKKPPTTNHQPSFADEHQQLAFSLLVDREVGVDREVAEILARSLPPLDIYRVVDDWLPDRRAGKVRPPSLCHRLERTEPSNAPYVTLSPDFLASEVYHRHRLPDDLVRDPRQARRSEYNNFDF